MGKQSQKYLESSQKRLQLPMSKIMDQMLSFCQYKIINPKESGLKFCTSSPHRKFNIQIQFQKSYGTLSKQQKCRFYNELIEFMQNYVIGKKLQTNQSFISNGYKMSQTLKKWKKKVIQLKQNSNQLMVISKKKQRKFYLGSYIIRKSKNNQKYAFVLMPVQDQDIKQIKIGFDRSNQCTYLYQLIWLCICKEIKKKQITRWKNNEVIWQQILKRNKKIKKQSQQVSQSKEISKEICKEIKKQQKKKENNIQQKKQLIKENNQEFKSISQLKQTQSILNFKQESILIQETQNLIKMKDSIFKKKKIKDPTKIKNTDTYDHAVRKLLPNYRLFKIHSDFGYRTIFINSQIRIMENIQNSMNFKFVMILKCSKSFIFNNLSTPEKQQKFNKIIDYGSTKVCITSSNSCIQYEAHKSYGFTWRQRDYLYLRHVFSIQNTIYMIDRSIESLNYPQFYYIIRGNIKHRVWAITQRQDDSLLQMQMQIDHKGLLNIQNNKALSLSYIEEFKNLSHLINLEYNIHQSLNPFNEKWYYCELFEQQKTVFLEEQKSKQQILDQQDQQSIIDVPNQVNQKNNFLEDFNNQTLQMDLDTQQNIILPSQYLKQSFRMTPIEQGKFVPQYLQIIKGSAIWKGNWKFLEDGTLQFIQQNILSAQSKVLGYIISKMGTNLFSGKGIMNISLPVQIFQPVQICLTRSVLQRIGFSLSFAPPFFQNIIDSIQRFKKTVAFAILHSILYLNMQKPFNPILGQTYQGWIQGCPIYCQQICHHPPISSIYIIGRGFKIYGSIEAVAKLKLNGGNGYNEGWFNVVFDDGDHFLFNTPEGELTGTVSGPRIFQLAGKCKTIITSIFCKFEQQNIFGIGFQSIQERIFQSWKAKISSKLHLRECI